MPTILQINSVINSGSTGRIAEEIGQIAINAGWKSYIAYGRNERPSQSHKIKIGYGYDIKLHGLKTRLFDTHGFGSKKATIHLIKQIQSIKPGIIHLHNLHGYYLNIEILFHYLACADIPVVWTLHDCWAFTGHCSHFTFAGCDKWKTHCGRCPQKKEYPSSLLIDNSYRNFERKCQLFTSVENMTIVSVSSWMRDLLKQSFFYKCPTTVIHNGIDTSIFSPQNTTEIKRRYNLSKKFVILGVAGTWETRKGLNDFIRLSKQLNDNEIIILVGLSGRQMKNIPSNIIGISRTENLSQLAELYSAADVLLNPTWEDNFPTVNLEALACGTPVITYQTGGSIEAVDIKTGFIVEQGNLEEVRDAIETIKGRGKDFYTEACRERATKVFNKNDRYQEYIQLYEQLLNNK